MRRFWVGSAVAALVLFVGWNAVFLSLPRQIYRWDHALWRAKFDLIASIDEPAEVVVLGDSGTISGIDPLRAKRKTLNLALACGGPIEAGVIYDHYRQKHAPPRILVVEFAEYYFYGLDCFSQYVLSYDFFSLREKYGILSGFEGSPRKLSLFGANEIVFERLGIPDRLRHLAFIALNAIHFTPDQLAWARTVLRVQDWPAYDNDYEMSFRQRGHFVIGLAKGWGRVRTGNFVFDRFDPHPAIMKGLEGVVDRATREGTRVLIRFVPINPATLASFSELHRTQFRAYWDDFERRYPGAQVEDYIRSWPPEMFGDKDLHLNAEGAKLETAHLEEAIDALDR